MRVESRHTAVPRTRRATVAVVLLLGGPGLTFAAGIDAAAGQTVAGPPSLTAARRSVEKAEDRRDTVTAERNLARVRLRELTAESADIVQQLADARQELRDRAVAAYVGSAPLADPVLSMLTDDFADASARAQIAATAADDAHETVRRYRRLRARVSPEVARLSRSLQQLDQKVRDAEDAVYAARATEAEAERQVDLQARLVTAAMTTTTIDAVVAGATEEAPTTASATTAPTPAEPTPAAPSPAAPTPAAPVTEAPVTAAPTTAPPAPSSPPPTAAPAPAPPSPTPPPPPGGPSEAQWARLRQCESGGNYRAVSRSGRYRGAYQFDMRTWATLGSPGDPAAASPAEQDYRAKLLYSRRGWRPWPVCGKHLR